MEKTFTREDTKAMKGIAVIMLLVGHLWPFMDRHPAGFEWTAPVSDRKSDGWFEKKMNAIGIMITNTFQKLRYRPSSTSCSFVPLFIW